MDDQILGIVVGVVLAVGDVGSPTMDVDRGVGAFENEGGMGPPRCIERRLGRDLIQPVQGLRQAVKEFPVPGQPVEAEHRLDVGARRMGDEGLRFDRPRAGRL